MAGPVVDGEPILRTTPREDRDGCVRALLPLIENNPNIVLHPNPVRYLDREKRRKDGLLFIALDVAGVDSDEIKTREGLVYQVVSGFGGKRYSRRYHPGNEIPFLGSDNLEIQNTFSYSFGPGLDFNKDRD